MNFDQPNLAPRVRLPLVRVSPGGRAECVIQCRKVFWLPVHWISKRGYACPGVDCPACLVGLGYRHRAFLVVRIDGKPMLLELSDQSGGRLVGLFRLEYEDQDFDLFGRGVLLSRARLKSPLVAEPLAEMDDPDVRPVFSVEGVACCALALFGVDVAANTPQFLDVARLRCRRVLASAIASETSRRVDLAR